MTRTRKLGIAAALLAIMLAVLVLAPGTKAGTNRLQEVPKESFAFVHGARLCAQMATVNRELQISLSPASIPAP